MNRKPYSAGAVKFAFWFPEFRKEIAMLSEGLSFDEIKTVCLEQNMFNASTPARATMIYQTVTARIQELDSSIYPLFQQSDLATQKLINLTAIMMHESLFFDFMYEVFKEKILIGTNELSDKDIRIFFRDKQLQDSKAATFPNGLPRWTKKSKFPPSGSLPAKPTRSTTGYLTIRRNRNWKSAVILNG